MRIFNKWAFISIAEYERTNERYRSLAKELFQANKRIAYYEAIGEEMQNLRANINELNEKYARALDRNVVFAEKILQLLEADGLIAKPETQAGGDMNHE